MVTKEQERKALAKIEAILAELGEDSYVGMAMKGVIDDAKQNIENDWGMSYYDRWEESEKKLARAKAEMAEQFARAEELEKRCVLLQAAVMTVDEMGDIAGLIADHRYVCFDEKNRTAEKIVEFAEEPQGLAFKEAVANNRRAAANEEKCRLVLEMLDKYEVKVGKL